MVVNKNYEYKINRKKYLSVKDDMANNSNPTGFEFR